MSADIATGELPGTKGDWAGYYAMEDLIEMAKGTGVAAEEARALLESENLRRELQAMTIEDLGAIPDLYSTSKEDLEQWFKETFGG